MNMRPSLPRTLGESRQRRRRSRARRVAATATPQPSGWAIDSAAERVREAGGPLDRAAYSCQCGYQFSAPVSTTVHCPHCGTGQAW
jgi:hypothetical protein